MGEGGRQRVPADSLPDAAAAAPSLFTTRTRLVRKDTHRCTLAHAGTRIHTHTHTHKRTHARTHNHTHAHAGVGLCASECARHQPALARRAPCGVPRAPPADHSGYEGESEIPYRIR